MLKPTLEKVFEYASMPVHGTLSRKLRKGVRLQVNEGKIFEKAVLYLGEEFVRVSETEDNEAVNTYYGWDSILSVRTFSPQED